MLSSPSEQQQPLQESRSDAGGVPHELPTTALNKLGGWGFRAEGLILTEHGPAMYLKVLPERQAERQHFLNLAASGMHCDILNRLGIYWDFKQQSLQVPLGSTLQRYWESQIVVGVPLAFRVQPIAPEIQAREEWKRAIAQGQFPVGEYGDFLVHDIVDHLPAIATIDPAYARSFQSRLAFLMALDDRLTTACPSEVRQAVRKLINFHEQQFEVGTVQLSIALGHAPNDSSRAENNMTKVYARMQHWPVLVGVNEEADKGDLQMLCDGLRLRMQLAEAWTRDIQDSFEQALDLTQWNEISTRRVDPLQLARAQIARLRGA